MLACVISKAREGDYAAIRKSRSLWWTPCLGQQNITFDTGCVHEVNISVCPIVIINARWENRKHKIEMSSQKKALCIKHTGHRRKKSQFYNRHMFPGPLVTFVSHVLGRGGMGCVSNKRFVHPASLISDQVHLCIGTAALFISVWRHHI